MAWTAKLFGLLFFFFFCCKDCISTNLAHSSENDSDSINSVCIPPYNSAGDYCLLIDNAMRGPWNEMRDVCLAIGGNLVNLQDANILYEISQYIKRNGMDDVSYWVGATDEAEEGKWLWSSDNTTVKGGTPLWGHLNGQQPDGGKDQNCAVLYVRDMYFMHDDFCRDSIYGFICQPTASEELRPKSDRAINTKFNETNNECPHPYEIIGNACLQVFPELSYNWTEAKELCDGQYSHLAKIDDANLLGAVYDYLTQREIKTHLHIDGTDEASEGDWVWHDGTPVKRGTPFWDVTPEGSQKPDEGTCCNCVHLRYEYEYFFRDEYCSNKYGVICQYDM